MKNHQKNPAGNQKILDYMKRRFKIPSSFEHQVLISQITQAEAIEYGVEHWRRNRGTPGKEHCMGSIYWQINDCWPVASWSSLDYSKKLAEKYHRPGRWKALHYYAKRFYKPIIVSIAEGKQLSEIWGVNDLPHPEIFQLRWYLYQMDGFIVMSGMKSVTVPGCSSVKLESIDVSSLFDYRKIRLEGTFKINSTGQIQFVAKNCGVNPKMACPILQDLCKNFLNLDITMKITQNKDTPNDLKLTAMASIPFVGPENKFQGRCVLDDQGNICIKKQISTTNPELYDIPLSDLIDSFLDQEDIVVEIDATAKNPPLLLWASLSKNGALISDSFRSFSPPGDLPLENPQLHWSIIGGGGKQWQILIETAAVALYVHLYSVSIDFWVNDNFFFIPKHGTKIVNVTLLEPISDTDLEKALQVQSIFELIR